MKRDMKQSNTESVGNKPTSSKARMRKRFDKVVAVMCTIAMVFAMVPNVALGNDDALFEAMQQGEVVIMSAGTGNPPQAATPRRMTRLPSFKLPAKR